MEFVYIVLLVISGFLIINFDKKTLTKKDIKYLYLMWLVHLLTIFNYYYYIILNKGDAMFYWESSQVIENSFGNFSLGDFEYGTYFIIFINHFFAGILEMGFLSNSLLFGLFGFIGLLLFYRIVLSLIPYNSKFCNIKLFPLLFFLPNLHFWSSGIGKDTLIFLSIAMITYGFLYISKRFRFLLIIIGLTLIVFIRPHVALLLCISFGLVFALNRKITIFQRAPFVLLLIVFSIVILPAVLKFTKMEDTSIESFENFSTTQARYLSKAGSGVDINSYPYPLKVLTFLYRPFFFDINGIPAVVASFENLLLALLSIQVIRNKPIQTFRKAPLVIQGLFLFSMMGALIFSMSMSNLGITLRQRNMFLPGILLFMLWSLSYKRELVLKKRRVIRIPVFIEEFIKQVEEKFPKPAFQPSLPSYDQPITEIEAIKQDEIGIADDTKAEEIIPIEAEGVIPTAVEEVVPIEAGEIIPAEPDEITPAETEETIPSDTGEIVPIEAEVVTPIESEEVIPPEAEEIIPSIIEEIVPEAVEEVIPTEVEEIAPEETVEVVPTVVEEVIPTIAGVIITGNIYHVEHPRKGSFDIQISAITDDCVKGIITNGFASNLSGKPSTVGDKVTLNSQACVFSSGSSIFVPVFKKEKEKETEIAKEKETEVKKPVESVPSGKTDAGEIIEGNIYHVEHQRKGSFDIKITSLNDETVKGIITNGFATNLSGKPSAVGDKVTLNRQSCVFSKEKAP